MHINEFKEQAVKEYNDGKSANQIFIDAGLDVSILSKQYDYASKTISKWRNVNRKRIDIHYFKKKIKERKSANNC